MCRLDAARLLATVNGSTATLITSLADAKGPKLAPRVDFGMFAERSPGGKASRLRVLSILTQCGIMRLKSRVRLGSHELREPSLLFTPSRWRLRHRHADQPPLPGGRCAAAASSTRATSALGARPRPRHPTCVVRRSPAVDGVARTQGRGCGPPCDLGGRNIGADLEVLLYGQFRNDLTALRHMVMRSSAILYAGSEVIFAPRNVIVPEVGRARPEIARSVVLLPAPFAPTRPTASPLGNRDADIAHCQDGPVTGTHARESSHWIPPAVVRGA